MTLLLESVACFKELAGAHLKKKHGSTAKSHLTKPRDFGKKSFEQWYRLAIMHSATFGENNSI